MFPSFKTLLVFPITPTVSSHSLHRTLCLEHASPNTHKPFNIAQMHLMAFSNDPTQKSKCHHTPAGTHHSRFYSLAFSDIFSLTYYILICLLLHITYISNMLYIYDNQGFCYVWGCSPVLSTWYVLNKYLLNKWMNV